MVCMLRSPQEAKDWAFVNSERTLICYFYYKKLIYTLTKKVDRIHDLSICGVVLFSIFHDFELSIIILYVAC